MVAVIQEIRDKLLGLAGTSQAEGWECVLMQGSGTMSVEAIVNTCIPSSGRLLVASNGAYGIRMAKMAEMYGIPVDILSYSETEAVCGGSHYGPPRTAPPLCTSTPSSVCVICVCLGW